VFAAAVGDMTLLANCFDGDRVRSNAIGRSIHGLRVSADPTTALEQALVYAAMHGRPEAVAFLQDHGADPDATIDLQQSALHWAAFEGHLEIVELLLAHGADPERRDRRWNSTPRGWAEHGKRDAVVERLR
jgi:hypothetical protein